MHLLPQALTAHLASGALPAPGTYTNQNMFAFEIGYTEISFVITYAKAGAAATGQPRFRLEWRDSAGNTFVEPIVDATVVVAAEPRGRQKTYLGEWDGPIFDAVVTTDRWHYTFPIPPPARAARLLVTEVTANSGTAQIEVELRGRG